MKNRLLYRNSIEPNDWVDFYVRIDNNRYFDLNIEKDTSWYKNRKDGCISLWNGSHGMYEILEYEALDGKNKTQTTRRISSRNNKKSKKGNKTVKTRNRTTK